MAGSSNDGRPIKFADIRYTQKFVYPTFSNGKMSVAETYAALALGFLDPGSLPPMVIFHHDNRYWSRDARRLTIARALEENGYDNVLKQTNVIFAKRNDRTYAEQYRNLIENRLPSMRKKQFDGKTVEVANKKGRTCCFNMTSHKFRDDLIEHIASDHLSSKVEELKNVASYECCHCRKKTKLQVKRTGSNKQCKYYTVIRCCGCIVHQANPIEKRWQEVTLQDMVRFLTKFKGDEKLVIALQELLKLSARRFDDEDSD